MSTQASTPMDRPLTRRTTLMASAALLLSHRDSLLAQHQLGEKPGCTLGFSTYGMKSLKTEQAIKTLSNIGFDSIELTVWPGWDADSATIGKQRRNSLRRQFADSTLKLSSLMEHVSPLDDKRQRQAIKRLKLAAELAHDLVPGQPPLIQTVLGAGQFQREKSKLRDRLGDWVDLAESTQTTIAIKPHRGGVISKPSEAVWLIEQLGEPKRLRMVYDYSHYVFRNLTVDETVDTALPHTAHVALKDAVQTGDRVEFRLPSRSGQIDFSQVIRRFFKGGYRADFNCEVSSAVWKQNGYEPIAAAKQCYEVISAAFQKAKVPRAQ